MTINNVTKATAGTYAMTIYYATWNDRTFFISVNGGAAVSVLCLGDGSGAAIQSVTVSLSLSTTNSIRFYNDSAYAANLDRIVV